MITRSAFLRKVLGLVALLLLPGALLADAPAIKVACIGDSITAGFGISKDHLNYPQQLAAKLGPGYKVQNFGASGRTMLNSGNAPYQRTRNWTDAQAFQPDIAIVILGTNDSKPVNFAHITQFADDATALVRTLKALPSKTRVFIALPTPVFKTAFTINEENMIPIRGLIKSVAAQEKIPVIDLSAALADQKRLFGDGVHPNGAGAELIANAVIETLKKAQIITTP